MNFSTDDSEEETTQSRISHSQQDDSWADDSISLGPDTKKKVLVYMGIFGQNSINVF